MQAADAHFYNVIPRALGEAAATANKDTDNMTSPPSTPSKGATTLTDEVQKPSPGSPGKEPRLSMAQKVSLSSTVRKLLVQKNLLPRIFWCLDLDHPLRRVAVKVANSEAFETVSLLIILANCVMLAIFDPLDPDSLGPRNRAIEQSELWFQSLFTIEAAIKLLAFGVYGNGPQGGKVGYFADAWNWLDFFIVIAGFLVFIPGLSDVRALRTFRVLRPLKSLSAVPSMRIVVSSMLTALPALGNVVLLAGFTLIVFGIIGVQLWAGVLRGHCHYEDPLAPGTWVALPDVVCALPCDQQLGAECTPASGDACFPAPVRIADAAYAAAATGDPNAVEVIQDLPTACRASDNPYYGLVNFDDTGHAMLTLFTGITLEGWVDTMYYTQHAWGTKWLVAIYWVVMISFGAFFLLQLALAVIWESYQGSQASEEDKADELLAMHSGILVKYLLKKTIPWHVRWRRALTRWISPKAAAEVSQDPLPPPVSPAGGLLAQVMSLMPKPKPKPVHDPIWPALSAQTSKPLFSNILTGFIVLNTIQLAMPYYGMSKEYVHGLDVANYIFSAVFGVEMILKLLGDGPQRYLSDSFNQFDAAVVVLSFIDIALTQLMGDAAGGLAALRTFRLARVFKLARQWKDLNRLLSTIIRSLVNVSSAVGVLALVLFIFTLLQMQLFGGGYHAAVDDGRLEELPRVHWDNFWQAFVSTFTIVTGENWNAYLAEANLVFGVTAILVLTALVLIGNFVFLNLFLAILLGAFESGMEEEKAEKEAAEKAASLEAESSALEEGGGATTQADATADGSGTSAAGTGAASSHIPPDTPSRVVNSFSTSSSSPDGSLVIASPGALPLSATGVTVVSPLSTGSKQDSAAALLLAPSPSKASDTGMRMDVHHGETKSFMVNTGGIAVRVLKSGDVQLMAIDEVVTGSPLDPSVAYKKLSINTAVDASGGYARAQISLGVLPPSSAFRKACAVLVAHPWFENTILLLILISSINLALDEPRIARCSTLPMSDEQNCVALSQWLYYSDIVITALFVLEMTAKIVALGFVRHEGAYLRNSWNVLDFVIVLISVLSLALASLASRLRALRSLRALRALRPLRVVSRYPGLKLVVNAVIGAIPKVKNVLLINFLFLLLLAIVGLQNLSGAMAFCNDPSTPSKADCVGDWTLLDGDCNLLPSAADVQACLRTVEGVSFPRVWQSVPQNYDDVFKSVCTTFEVATGEAWPDIASPGVDAVGLDKTMQRDNNVAIWLYFITIQVACGFFLLELFTGVIIANYYQLKEESQGSGLLTAEQQQWVEQMKLMLSVNATRHMKKPLGENQLIRRFRNRCFAIAVSKPFEWFIMSLILANTAVLAMRHYGQNQQWVDAQEVANNVFAVFFAMEAAIKLSAFGPKQYFAVAWNKFDFALVLASGIGVLASVGPVATLFRIFRVARIIRLVRVSRGLLLLFRTLIVSIPSLINVGIILLLALFIFSIVGMNLFAGIRYGPGGGLTEDANFDAFFTSMITLFRSSTGENFNGLMHDLEIQAPYCYPVEGPNGEDPNCGDRIAPAVFFSLFFTLTGFILIKLLVAVVLDSFSDMLAAEQESEVFRLTPDWLEKYTDAWGLCDPGATKFLSATGLIKLITILEYPMGIQGHPEMDLSQASARKAAITVLSALDLPPSADGQYQFHAVLQELVKRSSSGRMMPSTRVQMTGDASTAQCSLRETLAAMRIQGLYRAKKARRFVHAVKLARQKQAAENGGVLPVAQKPKASRFGGLMLRTFTREKDDRPSTVHEQLAAAGTAAQSGSRFGRHARERREKDRLLYGE